MSKLRTYLLIAVAAWGTLLMPSRAMAYELLYCDGNGGVGGGALFYSEPNQPGSFCELANDPEPYRHIFSMIACDFTTVLNIVLGKVYCAMQFVLSDIVALLLTLYVMVFGVQLLLGTAQLNSKEIVTRLLKIAGVWVFMTEAAWGINLAFLFFIDVANQGVWWALSALTTSPIIMPPAPQGGLSDVMPVYFHFDNLIYESVVSVFSQSQAKLIGFFAVLAVIVPPIFMVAVYWLWTTFRILANALISFLMAISALAFLLSLSPIFLSFMLFRATYQFFENWLKYMISYALQVAIVFACITTWLITMSFFVGFFSDLSGVIFPYNKLKAQASPVLDGDSSWGVCPYEVTAGPLGPVIACTNTNFNPLDPADRDAMIDLANIQQYAEVGQQTALNELIDYVIYHLTTLILICYAFDALLKDAAKIAKELAGPQYVPMLGQGFGHAGIGRMKGGAMRNPFEGQGRGGGRGAGDAGDRTSRSVANVLGQYNQQVSTRR